MNTRKHLTIFYYLITIFLVISIIGIIICFIAIINGENAAPLLICASVTLGLYVTKVFLSAIIEIYDAVVPKHKPLH